MVGKVYVIISGKGGVGKTTSAINIGSSLNSIGKETIVVDGNLSTPNIGLHLGSPIAPITLNHVLNNQARPEEAIYEHESGMKIIPSSLSLMMSEGVNHGRLQDITKRLKKIAEYILVDSSASLGEESKSAIKSADEVIVVTNPEVASVTDALKAIKVAEKLKRDVCGCIITRHTGHKLDMDIPSIQDMLETTILGIIPEDNAIKESQSQKNAVIFTHPKSKAAQAYHQVTRKLLGPKYLDLRSQEIQQQKDRCVAPHQCRF